jgi:hypothetical protein
MIDAATLLRLPIPGKLDSNGKPLTLAAILDDWTCEFANADEIEKPVIDMITAALTTAREQDERNIDAMMAAVNILRGRVDDIERSWFNVLGEKQ